MFLKKTVLLSPEINGRLVNAGEPVVGQRIVRELSYGESYTDETVTDSEGEFHFERYEIKSSTPNNPFDETRIIQSLMTVINGNEIYLWGHLREVEDRKGIDVVDGKLNSAIFDLAQDDAQYVFIDPVGGYRRVIAGHIKVTGYVERYLFKDMGF